MEVGWRPYISRCLPLLCTAKREGKEACKRMEQEGARKGQLEQGPVRGSCIMQEVGEEDGGATKHVEKGRNETRKRLVPFPVVSSIGTPAKKTGFFFSLSCSTKYTAKPILLLLSLPLSQTTKKGRK